MIKIKYKKTEKPYRNIELTITNDERETKEILDFYWLCLDRIYLEKYGSNLKAVLSFIFLLVNWKKKLELAGDGVTFLPFDFSDQYVAGLLVRKGSGGRLEVGYGVTREYIGPGVSTVHIFDINPSFADLIITFDFFEMDLDCLIRNIDEGIYNVLSSGIERDSPFAPTVFT